MIFNQSRNSKNCAISHIPMSIEIHPTTNLPIFLNISSLVLDMTRNINKKKQNRNIVAKFILTLFSSSFGEGYLLRSIKTYTPYAPYCKYHSINRINIMRTIPSILLLRADVLYTQPPIVKRIMIVIQLSNKIAKIGKGILLNIPII